MLAACAWFFLVVDFGECFLELILIWVVVNSEASANCRRYSSKLARNAMQVLNSASVVQLNFALVEGCELHVA